MIEKVFIVMPAYNRQAYIAEAIGSVRAQIYPHWKLLVVDDGSSDETLKVAKFSSRGDERIEIITTDHLGASGARNVALSRMGKEFKFVAFLDSDDVWDRDALQVLTDSLSDQNKFVGAHGVNRFINQNGQPARWGNALNWPGTRRRIKNYLLIKLNAEAPTDFAVLVFANVIPIGAMLVRSWVFDQVGFFDPATSIHEDYDMWLRISLLGPIVFVNKCLYSYRVHPENQRSPRQVRVNQEKRMFSKMYNSGGLTRQQQRTLLAGYRWYQLYRASRRARSAYRKFVKREFRNSGRQFALTLKRIREAVTLNPL